MQSETGSFVSERLSNVTLKQHEKVVVVGAGVIGLSTAILAQQEGFEVTVMSDKHPTETTSAKAAASFKPHEVVYDDRVHLMVQQGWEDFGRLVSDFNEADTGVRKHLHWEASSAPKEPVAYLDVMEDFEEHMRPDVPGGYEYGWKYTTYFVDTSRYMSWLADRFESDGGTVIFDRKLESLDDLRDTPTDIIFNCSGLGARELVNDPLVRGLKGQIALIAPQPDMDWSINADGFYVYPRANETVLGGTVEESDNEAVEPGAIQLIVKGNRRILPHIKPGDVTKTYAGLRPYRDGSVRVEAEEKDSQRIIHNYGHGGSGITLSWGSARQALAFV